MKKSIIIIKKNTFIYNEEECDFNIIDDMRDFLKSNIKIIILEEDLYVKKFTNHLKGKKIYEFVNYKINNEFPQNGDMLYDFEKNNKAVAIYSIKGSKRIEKLCELAKNIEVKPIQFIVKDVMMEILKNNIFTGRVLIKFNDYYYYMSFEEGLFDHGFVEKDKEIIFDKIVRNSDFGEIYIDDTISDLSFKNQHKEIKVNIGELINEKIYKKQKFYS